MIKKLAANKWVARVDIGYSKEGTRKRKSGTFATKKEALAFEHMWSDRARQNKVILEDMLLEDFIVEYYLPSIEKRIRYSTYKRYLVDIRNKIIPCLGSKKLSALNVVNIQNMIDECTSHKSATNARATLRQVLNLAVKLGFIFNNPATEHFHFPERKIHPEEHNGTWLTTFSQHDEFIAALDKEPFKTIAVLGLSLGLRKGEIFALEWSDVDLEKRLVSISKTYVKESDGYKIKPPKTRKSVRKIPLRESSANYLRELKAARNSQQGAIVINKNGYRANPEKTASRYKAYLQSKNLPYVSILNMRHSFATACMNAGLDVTKVSKLLGHTQISTTVNRYVRYKIDDLVEEFDNLIS